MVGLIVGDTKRSLSHPGCLFATIHEVTPQTYSRLVNFKKVWVTKNLSQGSSPNPPGLDFQPTPAKRRRLGVLAACQSRDQTVKRSQTVDGKLG